MVLVYINDFELNSEANRFYVDEDLTGLALPDIRTSSGVYSGQDGGYVGAQFFGMRSISIMGTTFGDDVADIEQKRRDLLSVLRQKAVTLRVITNAGSDYVIGCNLISFDMPIKRTVTVAPFKIELLAPDPVIYDNTAGGLITATLTRVTGGGYVFPIVYPVIWGAGTQPTNVINSGTATIFPTITITGAATNPKISNLTTGKFFKINGLTMGASDVLVIDMKNRTVLLNGGSIFYLVTTDSKWLDLQLDDNLMQFETDSSGDTGVAVVSYRTGYMGI